MTFSQMTGRERILAAMRRQPVDYVPCVPAFNPLHERQRVGHLWQFPWGPSDRERCEYCRDILGVDQLLNGHIPSENPAPGVSAKVWMEGEIIHKVWYTPSGDLSAAVRYAPQWIHGRDIPFFSDFLIGHSVKHWIETAQDVECLGHILRPPEDAATLERLRFAYMELKALADGLQLPIAANAGMGLTGAMQMVGSTEVCLMAAEKPEILDAYLEMEHRTNLKIIDMVADLGAHIVLRNGFYETGDFYSPAMCGRFLAARLKREARAARQAGMVTAYTINTGVMPIREYLDDLEFDCFNAIDIAFTGFDLREFCRSQGEKRSYLIGPSSVYHVWKEDPKLTRGAVRQCFEVIGKRGLIIGPCPSAHSIMPWANTLAMIEEWKKWR